MEKINSIVVFILLIVTSIQAQNPTEKKGGTAFHVVHRELHLEGGTELSMIYNDTLSQRVGSTPFLTFHYHNYLNEKVKWTLFVTPIAMHITKNEKQTLRERYFQIESGLTGSYNLYGDFWVSAGGGYAYRLFKDYKRGANAWEETNFDQPGVFLTGSVDYWIRTTSGVRFSTVISQEGYIMKLGVFMNFDTLLRLLKPKE
jgi:hypothetical protein